MKFFRNKTKISEEPNLRKSSTKEFNLYEGCLEKEWCMNDSERMGLIALLEKYKPRHCIEIGTFLGGSLSLLCQYAEKTFSIDVDDTIPEKLSFLQNVEFLSGYSENILPRLFERLSKSDISVDLVLIDGDHSYEGVKKDINMIIKYYNPTSPMFVVLHDSFNPGCRKGMLDADWNKSEYLQWIDLDFIPGRVVTVRNTEREELWGGLAFAYFAPKKRNGPLEIKMQAKTMFEELERIYSAK